MESIVSELQAILDRFPAAVYTLVPGSLCVPEEEDAYQTAAAECASACRSMCYVRLTDAEQVERACMEG
jgi:hypothetical protein